jgi:hypothetical protein
MSQGDSVTGGTGTTDTSGLDQTFSDASLGDQFMGGSGDIFGGDATAAGGFNSFNSIANALAGGGAGASPQAAQAASMSTPPSATGGDPTGSSSGTQSSTTPGQSQNQGPPQQNQQQQQAYAPPDAVQELNKLLEKIQGKPPGPTGLTPKPPIGGGAGNVLESHLPLEEATAEANDAANSIRARQMPLPGVTPGETGPQSPQITLPGVSKGETGPQSQPPVRGMPPPRNEPGEVAPGGPALPTKKPTQPEAEQPAETEQPAEAAPPPQAPSRIMQDISGQSTGVPTALAELAQIAMPLIAMALSGGGGRRGRGFGGFGGFRGGFRGGRGGFRGGFHPPGRGLWPYHHPQMGWHFHHGHPGGGWLPLSPQQADQMGMTGGDQQGGGPGDPNAPDPNRPPKETGAAAGPPDQTPTSGAIPNVGAKEVDDYTRQAAQKYNIDPNIASKFLGQESSYGQARRPGDAGTSFGPFQLHFAPDGHAMGDDFQRDTGLDPRDPRTWKQQIDYAMMRAAKDGWSPGWTTTMKKLGLTQWAGINRSFKGQPYSKTIDPKRDIPAYSTGNAAAQLPPSSQGMVAGQ